MTRQNQALFQLTELPIPVIAAVNGSAYGGGCEILTACDLRLTTESARFGFVQIKNSLTTGWGGTGRLVRLLGQSRALELLLTGRIFSATEAQEMGLIHRIVSGDVLTAANEWAQQLITLPRSALAANKALVHAATRLSLLETTHYEAKLFADLWPHPDHIEAMQAFVEKRPPKFNR